MIRTNATTVIIPWFRVGEPEIRDLPEVIKVCQAAASANTHKAPA